MKIQEIRQLPEKKLHELHQKTKRDLAIAKFHAKSGQNQDTAKIAKLKKMVAQILTLLKSKKSQPLKK